ncbi:MAG: 16S rRNA (uracil(1498)-N(3))-methyltransferase [Muribaculaceae bacterium]|nr:16S rRNA (uracil(1498)-N(3))-methyltransferase [Muribaculaceae bacterium]
MIQFYAPDIEKELCLPEGESGHCCRVLRKKEGDEIIVTDGKGHRFICEIIKDNPKRTELKIKGKETFKLERNYSLTLAVAPTKNADRMEWLAEKAVEIGIDRIVLIRCERSERKVLRPERLLKVMISAMKQSLSTFLPLISEDKPFKDFINEDFGMAQKFLGYCSDLYPRKSFVKECSPGREVVVMIGPEGDFTEKEVEKAVEKGFMPVTFGDKRLRTETAGIFAVAAVDVINQLQNT